MEDMPYMVNGSIPVSSTVIAEEIATLHMLVRENAKLISIGIFKDPPLESIS